MKRLCLFLAGCCLFGSVESARAQYPLPPQSEWWFGDWQYGLPLWPPPQYWNPAYLPSPGPFYYLRKQHFGKYHVQEAPPLAKPAPADLPPPKPLPPEPAANQVRIDVATPDPYGLLYVNGEKTSAGIRYYLADNVAAGKSHTFQLRAAFRVGNDLLIEDRQVEVQAGQSIAVQFEGKNAMRVPLPAEARK